MDRNIPPPAPRKTRTTTISSRLTQMKEDVTSLKYYSSILEVDLICNNALKALRNNHDPTKRFLKELEDDAWKFTFDFPIFPKP